MATRAVLDLRLDAPGSAPQYARGVLVEVDAFGVFSFEGQRWRITRGLRAPSRDPVELRGPAWAVCVPVEADAEAWTARWLIPAASS